jgi:hypothetical protein
MRWNVLFDELEHRFDEITQAQPVRNSAEEPLFESVVRASISAAKRDRAACTLTLRSGHDLTLVPRALGTDFASGSVSTGGVDAVIPLSAVVGVRPAKPSSETSPTRATVVEMLQLWAARRQPCVVAVAGRENIGFFRSITPSVMNFSLFSAHQVSNVIWDLSAIEIVRTLTSAEEESIRG